MAGVTFCPPSVHSGDPARKLVFRWGSFVAENSVTTFGSGINPLFLGHRFVSHDACINEPRREKLLFDHKSLSHRDRIASPPPAGTTLKLQLLMVRTTNTVRRS